MIHFFVGENSFEMNRAIKALADSFDGEVTKIDASDLSLAMLPTVLMASTLFSEKRLVIIKEASQISTIWNALPEWLERLSPDVTLVLSDTKPDKRTTTYKALKAAAEYQEFLPWSDKDGATAVLWVQEEAKALGLNLEKKFAQLIVERVGHDQWSLYSALEKLSLVETINTEAIVDLIDAMPSENVFNLFETALSGDIRKLQQMIRTLELTEDPYKLFGLLSSQVFQLMVVHSAGRDDVPAKDFGMHPFVLSKLSTHARKLSRADMKRIVEAFAKSDADMKSSTADPWLLVERALIQASKNSP